MKREPVVKFYKSLEKGGNGAFAVATTAVDADEFLRCAATELCLVVERLDGDLAFTFDELLPKLCELWSKLRGYKCDGVHEQRLLIVGDPRPDLHMTMVNDYDFDKKDEPEK